MALLLYLFHIHDRKVFLSKASQHPPKMSFGTVTSWLTITSAWPMQAGCSSALWNVWSTAIVAFDPGYGLGVDSLFSCLPPAATTWWEQSHTSYSGTTFRLGPLVCPQAYTTASTSKQDETSTFIACCPSYVVLLTTFLSQHLVLCHY